MQLQAGQGKDDLPVVVVLLRLGRAATPGGPCSFYRIGGDLPFAFQHWKAIHSCVGRNTRFILYFLNKSLNKLTINFTVSKSIVEPLIKRLELRRENYVPGDATDDGHRMVLLLLHLCRLSQRRGECLGDQNFVFALPRLRGKVNGWGSQAKQSPRL